jgi:Flp pilus assembly pilin Flp
MRWFLKTKTSLQALHAIATNRTPRPEGGRGASDLEHGAVTSEYALLLALVAMAVIASMILLGVAVAGLFEHGAAGVPGA